MPENKTASLLLSGGDERLTLNSNGINKYGCRPTPDNEILAFSSSTASPVTRSSFQVADQLRVCVENSGFSDEIFLQENQRQKTEWRNLIELKNDVKLIFSPSGTDLHSLVANQIEDNTLVIMVDGNETGSGVANALNRGRGIEVVSVPLRSSDNSPRSISDIDNDVLHRVEIEIKTRNVLLILVDQSKTGMIAPNPACAIALKEKYAHRLNVLIDACQFRLSSKTLNAYLRQNFMVALTGSKFLAAPSFSAILMLPPEIKFTEKQEETNFGLLLRMEIALEEYRKFCKLSDSQINAVITDFSKSVLNYLNDSPFFQPLETPILDRAGLMQNAEWDTLKTIFPFILLRNHQPLSRAETLAIYQELPNKQPRCQIGQPVLCGEKESALRLCLSAPLIVRAAQNESQRKICIQEGLTVLKTIENIFNCTSTTF